MAEARAIDILSRAKGGRPPPPPPGGGSSRKMSTEELMEEARRREAKKAIAEALGEEEDASPPAAQHIHSNSSTPSIAAPHANTTTPHSQRFPVGGQQQPPPPPQPVGAQYNPHQETPPQHRTPQPSMPPNQQTPSNPSYSVSGSSAPTSNWEPHPQPPHQQTPQQHYIQPQQQHIHQPQHNDYQQQQFSHQQQQQQQHPQVQQDQVQQQQYGQQQQQMQQQERQYGQQPQQQRPPQPALSPASLRRPSTASASMGGPNGVGTPSHNGSVRRQSSVGGGGRYDSGEVTLAMVTDPYAGRSQHGRSQLNPQAVAAATHRLLHLDPTQFTQQDVVELLKVIEASNRYGREIEHSVEEIATLLERKTLECEGLRRLASENHSTLASAVKSEYNSRVRMETKQGNEIRSLQTKIAAMRVEKDELQQEVESLRMMVKQLQSTPDPLNARETGGGDTLFNRLAGGGGSTGMVSGAGDGITSWNMPRPSQLVASQRNLVNLVGNMDGDVATKLHSSGAFDFLLVLCQRLCTPVAGKDDVYPEMGVVVGQVLQELRAERGLSGTGGAAMGSPNVSWGADGALVAPPNDSLAHQAATIPIPLVRKSYRQRVIDLYLANNPEDYSKPSTIEDLHRLLEKWDGREDELYRKLLKEYKTRDPAGEFMNRVPTSSSVYSGGTMNSEQLSAAVSPTPYSQRYQDGESAPSDSELHLRVVLMYKKYNPDKLETRDFGELVRKYPPETLLKALVERYGPEPTLLERKRIVKAIEEGDG